MTEQKKYPRHLFVTPESIEVTEFACAKWANVKVDAFNSRVNDDELEYISLREHFELLAQARSEAAGKTLGALEDAMELLDYASFEHRAVCNWDAQVPNCTCGAWEMERKKNELLDDWEALQVIEDDEPAPVQGSAPVGAGEGRE